MPVLRRLAVAASAAACVTLSIVVPAGASSLPGLPQVTDAQQAAAWLAAGVNAQGFVPSAPGATTPSLSGTAWTVMALSAARTNLVVAERALTYLQANVDKYVVQGGADGPGQLALLILDAEALGANPRSFGSTGTDLVSRLLATQQASGPDAGLFGTEAQVANYLAGTYDQGLALAALAAAGVTGTGQTAAAVAWLVAQQCPDGGWTLPDQAQNACTGTPAAYGGPDTNSTSLAVQGLVAQGALASNPAVASSALSFFKGAQDTDAGWSYFPNTAATAGVTDPDSTALVVQALLALGQSPTAAAYVKGSADPVGAMLAFRVTSGSGAGAFASTLPATSADLLATYQVVPALVGLAFPWSPAPAPVAVGPAAPASTTTTLVLSAPAVTVGAEQDLTATVTVASSAGTPTGAVTVASGGTTLCTISLVGGTGTCRLASSQLSAGSYTVTAAYPAASSWAASQSPSQTLVVDPAPVAKPSGGKSPQPSAGPIPPASNGYVLVTADGSAYAYGRPYDGGAGTLAGGPGARIVAVAADPQAGGYWEAGADGSVFAFGAPYLGGANTVPGGLHTAVVGIAAAPGGAGYWEVGVDGSVFAFGAPYLGGANTLPGGLPAPAVGIAAAPGGGYWIATADGTVYAFGVGPSARRSASTGSATGGAPVVGIAAAGGGYVLAAADGAVYAYGTAYHGGANTLAGGLGGPIVAVAADPQTGGYWEVGAGGAVYAFGAPYLGGANTLPGGTTGPVVGIG